MPTGQTSRSAAYVGRNVNYDRPHQVYRAFDSYGLLLYVGCSLNVDKRLASHRSQAPWFRFAETLAVVGGWDRVEALRVEREAIETEGPYFNSSHADMVRTRLNHHAAVRRLAVRGHAEPNVDWDRYNADPGYWDAEYAPAHDCWRRAVEREVLALKASSRPFLTDADRLARYLAAREDAELARLEAAA